MKVSKQLVICLFLALSNSAEAIQLKNRIAKQEEALTPTETLEELKHEPAAVLIGDNNAVIKPPSYQASLLEKSELVEQVNQNKIRSEK